MDEECWVDAPDNTRVAVASSQCIARFKFIINRSFLKGRGSPRGLGFGVWVVSTSAPGATADYNIQVDSAGAYNLGLRVFGTGKIDVMEKDQVLGSGTAGGDEVQTLQIPAQLPAGPQTLRIRFASSGTILSSIEFAKQEHP